MRRSVIPLLIAVAFSQMVAGAQPGAVGTPRIGFAFDARNGAIRPLRGIPGAAMLGDGIHTGNIAAAAISPRQDYALVRIGEDRRVYFLRLNADTPELSLVTGAMPDADQMVFSTTGRAAALYSSESRRLQTVSGFDGVPEVRDLAAPGLAGPPAAIAVSDDAQVIVLASSDDNGAVWWVDRSGTQNTLPVFAAALAFSRDGSRLLAVSRAGDVYQVRKSGGDFEVQTISSGTELTADPVAAAFAAGETRALAVNAKGTVAVIDLAAGSLSTVSCRCRPVTLQPQTTESLFRLNDISNLPVMLLDITLPEARFWFIPADPPDPNPAVTDSGRSRQ